MEVASYEGGGKELDELLNLVLALPVLEQVALDCELPQDVRKTLEKRGVEWVREKIY